MKTFIFSVSIFLSTTSYCQINALATVGVPCDNYTYAHIDFEDAVDNSPYTINLYFDNSDPFPDLLMGSTSVNSNDTLVVFPVSGWPGNIVFIIIDVNGDSSTFYAYPPGLGLTGSIVNCSCAYGVIAGYAQGGTPPYNFYFQVGGYSLDTTSYNDTANYTSVILSGFSCQPYPFLTITDAAGCSMSFMPPIDGDCGPGLDPNCPKEVFLTIQNTSAIDVCDGSISWQIEDVDTTTAHELIILFAYIPIDTLELIPGQLSGTLTNLCNGYYQFKLDKDSTCYDFTSGNLYDPAQPVSTSFLEADSVIACNVCENSISWNFEDHYSNGPYQILLLDSLGTVIESDSFNWNNCSGQFAPLCQGDYQVIIVNQAGDSLLTSTTVFDILPIQMDSVTITYPNTNQFDGEIEIFCSGGTSPYQYSIDNGLTWQSGNMFSDLDSGAYTVLIKDSTGCTISSTTNLINGDVGLSELQQLVQIFPNPSNGIFNVNVFGKQNYQLQDMQGRVLQKNQFTDKVQIDLSNEPKGVYLLLIDSETNRSMHLILLQ